VKLPKNAKIEKTAVLQPQYEQVAQLWRSYGCCNPTQPKLPLKCRVFVLSPQTTLPELPDPQNHAKTGRAILPDPKKCPGKSLRRRDPFFKTEKPGAASNESPTNSVINERHLKSAATLLILNRSPRQLHKNQPSAFINFSIRWAVQKKSQLGCPEIFR
jgi:hypothetical protein